MNAEDFIAGEWAAGRLKALHVAHLTRLWQKAHGLDVDGKPGKDTRASIEAELGAPPLGIDVSRHQGAIDWQAVGASTAPKVRFCWIKASTGVDAPQPRFAKNVAGARAAGVPWGAYHWATPSGGASDALAEADDFVSRLAAVLPTRPNIPCALDLEERTALTGVKLANWVRVWLDRVETGLTSLDPSMRRRPWVYTGPGFIQSRLGAAGVKVLKGERLWIADYTGDVNSTLGWPWAIRQYSSTGKIPGIKGNVDMDKFEDMAAWEGFVVP